MSGLEELETRLRSVPERKQAALFAAATVLQNIVAAETSKHVRTGKLEGESVVLVVGDHIEHIGPYYSWFVKGLTFRRGFTEGELTQAKLALVKELLA